MSTVKKTLLYSGLFITAYIVGLVIYFPTTILDQELRARAGNAISWQSIGLDWSGVYLKKVLLQTPAANATISVDEITLHPNLLSLLTGELSTDFSATLPFATIDGRGSLVDDGAVALSWEGELTDINNALQLFGVKQTLLDINGNVKLEGDLQLQRNPISLDDGNWKATFTDLDTGVATLVRGHVIGRIKNNLVKMDISARGDVALNGKTQVQLQFPKIRDSRVSGRIEVRPDTEGADSAAQVLSNGKPIAITLSGPLEKLRWKIN